MDEPIHITSGILEARNFGTTSIAMEHPPLAKLFYGLAATWRGRVADDPVISFRDYHRSIQRYLFRDRPSAPPGSVLIAARAAAIAFFLVLVVAVFAAAGGEWPGALAAALLVGQGALLSHGSLATTDVPIALATASLAGALVSYLSRPRASLVAVATLSVAFGLLVKHSGLLLLVGACVFFLVAARDPAKRRTSLVAAFVLPLASVLLVALAMWVFTRREPPGTTALLCGLYRLPAVDASWLVRLDGWNRGLARWLLGLDFVMRQTQGGQPTYFLGHVTNRPGAAYHAVALLVKSSLVWLGAVAAGAVLAFRRQEAARARALYVAAAFLFALSLPGPRIGIRHAFPVIVVLTVAAALALAPVLSEIHGGTAIALFVSLTPLLCGTTLGWFNSLARPLPDPPLADSNLDWGQDLLRLRDALPGLRIPQVQLAVAYFGGDMPSVRLPGALDVLEEPMTPRRYLAISRQLELLGPDGAYISSTKSAVVRVLDLLHGSPAPHFVARVGDSIDVYDLGPPAPK